jgi:hypothetical protein
VVLAALLAGCGGDSTPTPTTVFGREARGLAVGISVQRDGGTAAVRAMVLGEDGNALPGLDVEFAPDGGPWARAEPCGKGRYCTEIKVTGEAPRVRARITRPTGAVSNLAATLPADPQVERAGEIIRGAARAIRGLHSLIVQEYLSSGPRYPVLETTFTFVAPDQMIYRIEGAGEAIVIGARRWDRERAGKPWERLRQDPLRVPAPDWRQALFPSLLGEGERNGRPVWRVSFYDSTIPAWFEMDIDQETNLPLWMSMIGAAHFMTRDFRAFNAPLTVSPPR